MSVHGPSLRIGAVFGFAAGLAVALLWAALR